MKLAFCQLKALFSLMLILSLLLRIWSPPEAEGGG